ncbi:RDD family protein [Sulfitobacter sp. F26204]|uniref:RDD family protein n=1 Tax=Sulfitobacter sp. F26204 TaxID=2996014 RepID=UPI00225E6A8A|nr:RDD family protein [Sulfitobacter sp. F26204]MCX7559969.1 RDD family protein [Sulfitobacter sp. F26204]
MTPDPDILPQFYQGVPSKRLFAWVVDTVLVVAICLIIVPFTAFTGLFFFPLLMLVVGFIYRVATLASGSATWGMRLLSVELRQADDHPLEGTTALLHTLGYTISLAMPFLQLISIILMLTSARRQGLTDMILGTVALNRRR